MSDFTLKDFVARRKFPSEDVIAIFAMFVIVILLWIPFGFNVGFFADDWALFREADNGNYINSSLPRPLTGVPFAIAYALDPISFRGPNILLAFILLGKAVLCYALVNQLFRNKEIAFATAMLFLVIPADTAIFNLGTLTIHFALVCYLLAVYFLILIYRKMHPVALLGMWLALATSLGIYETVFPLALVTPFVLLFIHRRISRRFLIYAGLWYAVLLVVLERLFLLYTQQAQNFGYQQSLYIGLPTIEEMIAALQAVYGRLFYTGWIGYDTTVDNSTFWLLGLTAGVISLVVVRLLTKQTDSSTNLPKAAGILLGLLIVGLGYGPYIVTELRLNTDRTYVFASLGAAISLALLIHIVMGRLPYGRYWRTLCLAIFVTLGTVCLINQHARYTQAAEAQEAILRSIVRQVPEMRLGSRIVVFDQTADHLAGATFFRLSPYLNVALQVIYDDLSLNGTFCYPGEQWGTFQERCTLTLDELTITYGEIPVGSWRYEDIIAFQYVSLDDIRLLSDLAAFTTDVGAIPLYNPTARIEQGTLPVRALTMLGMLPEHE